MNCFNRDKNKKAGKKKDNGSDKGNRSNEDLLDTGDLSLADECPIEQALKELFQMYEITGEKVIPVMEMGKIMTLLGMNPTDLDVKKVIATIKKDEFGLVGYKEYHAYMEKLLAKAEDPTVLRQEDKLLAAFLTLDKDQSGYIDRSYLREVLGCRGDMLSDIELDDLLKVSGTDNRGKVNYKELVKLWCQKTSNHG